MLHAVIMAGGSGTRFWPESRADNPKQLLRMLGDRSMVQATVDRLGDLVPLERVFVATTERLAGPIAEQLSQLPREAVLVEPCKRDTAPCIGLAALRIARCDPNATMAVMPSDHVIGPDESFREAIRLAAALVEDKPQRLVTFGVRPTYPAESFGYVERGEALAWQAATGSSPMPSYLVKQFHEKPSAEVARRYLGAGRYYWNSGIFVWKAQTILDALARYEPATFARLERIAEAADSPEFRDVLDREYSAIGRQGARSIDFAVMEPAAEAGNVVVIEAPFVWDDVGSWRALERLHQPDENGNVVRADRHLAIRTAGTIVRSNVPGHAVVLVGVENLVVIVTPDATLVASKHDEESIRAVTGLIDERGWHELL
jgi:mannose-1-phosphate guanylyltransferase